MIVRYLAILLISLLAAAAFVLPETPINLPTYKNSESKVKSTIPNQFPTYPFPTNNYQEPKSLTARSVVVIDAKTGISLFEKNPHLKHLPASTTKLMTALVTLEKCSPTTIVTVDQIEEEGTQMGLEVGDKIAVESLLYGLLINSGNDAAQVLASSCSTSFDQFISSMNRKAEDLDLTNTHFTNPTGFDDKYQYSTAFDLAKLSNVAISNPLVSKIVTTRSTVVTDFTGNKTYYLENINELLGLVDGIEGVKTGQTEGSLENLISQTTRNGNSIIVAILGSEDRFGESEQLIEWAFENFNWLASQ